MQRKQAARIGATVSVLLIDNDATRRELYKASLAVDNGHNRFQVDTAKNTILARKVLRKNTYHIILLDINSRDRLVQQKISDVLSQAPSACILGLINKPNADVLNLARRTGIKGAITHSPYWRDLHTAIYHLLAGWEYYSPDVFMPDALGQVIERKFRGLPKNGLTARELEVLTLIASELTNEEIGQKLSVGKRTIDTHRENILSRLRVDNTVGLVKAALTFGLIELN